MNRKYFLVPAVASLMLGVSSGRYPAVAVTFGQQAVDQSRFMAIAVPFNNGTDYKLLLVEQLSDTQDCWQTDPATGVVDPLLLNFDFAKICARSTDSNGYSIRRAGQDLWQEYGLRLIKQENYLALMGVAHNNPTGPKIEIGRTQNLNPGFLQINLNPGWQLTKRTYDDKVLGHVYFTHDQPGTPGPGEPAGVQVADRPQPSSPVTNQATAPPNTQTTATAASSQPEKVEIPVQVEGSALAKPPALFRQPTASTSATSKTQEPNSIEIPVTVEVKPSTVASPAPGPSRPPAGSTGAAAAIALPPPPDLPSPPASNGRGLPVLTAGGPALPDQPPRRAQVSPPLPPPPSQGPGSSTIASGAAGIRYRVLVATADPTQQATIRSLVPDAFRSTYQGQPAMQVGSFEQRREADEVIQLMTQNGFQPVLEFSTAQSSALRTGSAVSAAAGPFTPLPVPSAAIPMGNAGDTPTIYAANPRGGSATDPPPPPTLGTLMGYRYRLVVEAKDSSQQAKIRSLVPDAFRSTYQGRSVIQVGAFKERSEAESVIQLMGQNGFQPLLVSVQ